MNEQIERILSKKAIIIENDYQFRKYKDICSTLNIFICMKNLKNTRYEMLIKSGGQWFSLPNTILEGSEDSVCGMNYIPITLKQFQHHIEDYRKLTGEKI